MTANCSCTIIINFFYIEACIGLVGILGYEIFTHFYFRIWDIDTIYFGILDVQKCWDMGYWNLFWDTS